FPSFFSLDGNHKQQRHLGRSALSAFWLFCRDFTSLVHHAGGLKGACRARQELAGTLHGNSSRHPPHRGTLLREGGSERWQDCERRATRSCCASGSARPSTTGRSAATRTSPRQRSGVWKHSSSNSSGDGDGCQTA